MRLKKPFSGSISASSWEIQRNDLEASISPKTRAIILNSPHNPTGKVYTPSELRMIVEVAQGHNILIISDEVVIQIIS